MATITSRLISGVSPCNGLPAQMNEVTVDFSVDNVTATDIVTLVQLPKNYVVLAAGYEIITAATASCTLDLGKAGGTELLSAIAIDGVAGTVGVQTFTTPVLFSGSDTIDFQINVATAIVGKIRLFWIGVDVTAMKSSADQ